MKNQKTIFRKLGARRYNLISSGTKTLGTYDPNEILPYFEESLFTDEVAPIINFLNWVHNNKKAFGSGNYEAIYSEFKKSLKNKIWDGTFTNFEEKTVDEIGLLLKDYSKTAIQEMKQFFKEEYGSTADNHSLAENISELTEPM